VKNSQVLAPSSPVVLPPVEKLRAVNAVPVWDEQGNMKVLKVPQDYDWDGLADALLQAVDLPLQIEIKNKPPMIDHAISGVSISVRSALADVEPEDKAKHSRPITATH
jgi:hypothetical protein